jgi:FemAB-related protein (PEP-CTERM system-associated)
VSSIDIRPLAEGEKAAWDAYVSGHAQATFFHQFGWRAAIEDSWGHDCPYLVAEQEGQIVGVLPLVSTRSLLFGSVLSSTAFAVSGGPLADSPDILDKLLDHAAGLVQEQKTDYLELRTATATHATWPVKAGVHAGFCKSLADNDADILLAIPRKQRAVVRKALQGSLHCEIDDDIERFFPLYAESVRNLGTPVFAKAWFASLKNVFGEACEISVVIGPDGPVSAVMSFYFRDQVLPYYVGGGLAARRLGANDLIYYDLMCRARQKGVQFFDFGRSKVGSGAFAYKKNFGFEPQPLHYQYYLPKGGDLPDQSPNSPKYQLAVLAWSKLPLWLANRLGPQLSQYLG